MTNSTHVRLSRRPGLPNVTAEHVLTLNCRESPGIIHAVSAFLLDRGCDVLDVKQYGDRNERHFFLRMHFSSSVQSFNAEELRRDFLPVAEQWGKVGS